MFLSILASVLVVPAGQSFECTPTHVWDGDGPIWCAEGSRIRVSGVAARETDGSCKPGHPCPDGNPMEARDHLVRLIGNPIGESPHGHILVQGPKMKCLSTGSAGGNRTGAWCISPRSGDLSCALVKSGLVARWDRYWRNHRCG